MSRRRDEGRYSRYDDRDKSRRMRSRSRDVSEEGNDLWDAQFMEPASYPRAPPAPTFSHEGGLPYTNTYTSYSGIYDDFPSAAGSSIPAAPQPPSIQWNQHMLPPAPEPVAIPAPAPPQQILEEQIKKEEAIESELRHQRATLTKQREEYTRKSAILKKELETLKDQRNELRGDSKRSPSPDSKRFLKENAKLQLEIQNKLKSINNVLDMLNGLIGENRGELLMKKQESDPDTSPERRATKRKSRSPAAKERKFNYVYYDPEMHWCRICNEFPPTAKDYLNHLHSAQHHKIAAAHLEAPWHGKPNSNEGLPNYPNAPTKRTPIRGLQFFVPSTAWYCKLCDDWIGDLHCASAHLKSLAHSKNYTNFVEQNPHWETDWMSDRQKAFEKCRSSDRASKPSAKQEDKQQYAAHTITFDKDGFTKKKKEKSSSPATPDKKRDKKKQKRKARSNSTSSSSESEHERKKEKKGKKMRQPKDKEENDTRDEKLIEQWMHCEKLTEKERKMLENLQNSIQRAKGKERREPPRDRQRERERERERERVAHVTQAKRQDFREEREKREDRERDKGREMRPEGGENKELKDGGHNGTNMDKKQNEPKKMPFIGKMPVFKSLSKTLKVEEQKETEQKKQDDEVAKKKRQEIDAEIQRKVAEFKLKIQTKADVGPPGLAMPTSLGGSVPTSLGGSVPTSRGTSVPPPNYTLPPPPLPNTFPQTIHRVQKDPVLVSGPVITATPQPKINSNSAGKGPLHRDFQEALDIIFPSEKKPEQQIIQNLQNEQKQGPMDMNMMYPAMGPPGMGPHFGPPMGPPFGPPVGMMPPPQMNGPSGPPMMMGYDFNPPMYGAPGPPQLYDRQVPMAPANMSAAPPAHQRASSKSSARHKQDNKSEMEDLAMLGIDAADVGACIH